MAWFSMENGPQFEVRQGGVDDVAEVVRLRQCMFAAMARSGAAARPDEAADQGWRSAGVRELEQQLTEWRSAAYVVDAPPDPPRAGPPPGQLVACAVASLEQRLPGPGFPTGLSGSMHTVFVEPVYRRHGLGRAVVSAALGWLVERGAETVDLHATPEAERLYRSLGFTEPRSVALRWLNPRRSGG